MHVFDIVMLIPVTLLTLVAYVGAGIGVYGILKSDAKEERDGYQRTFWVAMTVLIVMSAALGWLLQNLIG